MSTTKTKIYGLYGDDDLLLDGVKQLREKGIQIDEIYTPFPVHGLDKAMGLKESRLSEFAFVYGAIGLTVACLLTWYTMNHDWPQNIGAKPSFTWGQNMPAFVPIMFELTVLFAAHLMSITYLALNKHYPGQKAQNPDPRTTDDKFLIEISNQNFDYVKEILIATGVEEITVKKLEDEKIN
ncbi:DUF3341 domain-containing protein [Apibacter muscae]|uniref:DUF3341 domain-containing protein n=1 Tax=Apibacter muscae TaxID=2509004 RepID=UPI0011ACE04D|nr:DUF3341 domain-containing protein [Apibacter muscae]TWP31544.1 DUF3341 domain-containing protein [Apibacter muscae]